MHGLGNDFVLLDRLDGSPGVTPEEVAWLADRRLGVGCDQVVELVPETGAAARMIIHNADGSQAEMCGNAARCVGLYLRKYRGVTDAEMVLATGAGPVRLFPVTGTNRVAVDMGCPTFSGERTLTIARVSPAHGVPGVEQGVSGTVVSMGNPHFVVFADDVAAVALADVGPLLSEHVAFPNRTNVEFVQILDSANVRMRVWERGAGITPACGTGACAAAVAAAERGLTGRKVTVRLDGGELVIDWQEGGRVVMTGPAVEVFRGTLTP
ncbi:MAG: diaminopimelate epimerase [Magnetococcales bacterium]|nr:diaminopimelate epimerase [Magnetococcales bacterium]